MFDSILLVFFVASFVVMVGAGSLRIGLGPNQIERADAACQAQSRCGQDQ